MKSNQGGFFCALIRVFSLKVQIVGYYLIDRKSSVDFLIRRQVTRTYFSIFPRFSFCETSEAFPLLITAVFHYARWISFQLFVFVLFEVRFFRELKYDA